jgi:hypothetical protein
MAQTVAGAPDMTYIPSLYCFYSCSYQQACMTPVLDYLANLLQGWIHLTPKVIDEVIFPLIK